MRTTFMMKYVFKKKTGTYRDSFGKVKSSYIAVTLPAFVSDEGKQRNIEKGENFFSQTLEVRMNDKLDSDIDVIVYAGHEFKLVEGENNVGYGLKGTEHYSYKFTREI